MNTLYRPLEISALRAEIPVLIEVKEYLLVRCPLIISENQRIDKSKMVPLLSSAGEERTRSLGSMLLKCAIWEVLDSVLPMHFLAAENNASQWDTFQGRLFQVQLAFVTVAHVIWITIMHRDQVLFSADEFNENFFFLMFS